MSQRKSLVVPPLTWKLLVDEVTVPGRSDLQPGLILGELRSLALG